MKTKLFALLALLALVSLVQIALAQDDKKAKLGKAKLEKQGKLERQEPLKVVALPDLVVTKLSYPGPQQVQVSVTNQGKGNAPECQLAVMLLSGSGPASAPAKVWTVKVPALAAGKDYTATVDIAPQKVAEAAFKALVDRSNVVKETNENNNEKFDASKVIK